MAVIVGVLPAVPRDRFKALVVHSGDFVAAALQLPAMKLAKLPAFSSNGDYQSWLRQSCFIIGGFGRRLFEELGWGNFVLGLI